ncbi:hypothetical protein CLU79DRAFT_679134, partial [Phycomyces nitens]
MDGPVTEFFSSIYLYCYTQLLQLNIVLPAPDQAFNVMSSASTYIYEYSPENLRHFGIWLTSVPVQANIIPVFLAILVLYTIFSLVVWIVRGVFRLVYNFLRFSIIVAMTFTLVYVVQQYVS